MMNQIYPLITNLREVLNREPRRVELLKRCLPIVERHAMGPSGSDPKVWELLDAVKKEVEG